MHDQAVRPIAQPQTNKLAVTSADPRDAPTLQILHSHVADLSDEFLPLKPVFPLVPGHMSCGTPLGPRIRITDKSCPGLDEGRLLLVLLRWASWLFIVAPADWSTQAGRTGWEKGGCYWWDIASVLVPYRYVVRDRDPGEKRKETGGTEGCGELLHLVGISEVGWIFSCTRPPLLSPSLLLSHTQQSHNMKGGDVTNGTELLIHIPPCYIF